MEFRLDSVCEEGVGDAVSRMVVWAGQGKVWGVCLALAVALDGSREGGGQFIGRGRIQEAWALSSGNSGERRQSACPGGLQPAGRAFLCRC